MHAVTVWSAVVVAAVLVLAVWAAWPRRVGARSGDGSALPSPHAPSAARPQGAARVATFNIHGARGRDGRRDLSGIAEDLREAQVDIVALQEVHNTWRSGPQHELLAARLGLTVLYAPSRSRWFRHHRGNALLSRHALGAWQRQLLPTHPEQRFHYRNLTVVEPGPQWPVHILFTHLNRLDGNEAQLEQVMDAFLERSPAVLMGDFNMDRRHPALRAYLARDDVIDALGETLARDDPGRIDWILCRGLTPRRGGLIESGASDHPLYWCDLAVEPA